MRGINAAIFITITDTVVMSTSVYFSGRLREAQNEAAAETQGILKVKPMQWGGGARSQALHPSCFCFVEKVLRLQKLAGEEQGLGKPH